MQLICAFGFENIDMFSIKIHIVFLFCQGDVKPKIENINDKSPNLSFFNNSDKLLFFLSSRNPVMYLINLIFTPCNFVLLFLSYF